jgi:hypothetical protein
MRCFLFLLLSAGILAGNSAVAQVQSRAPFLGENDPDYIRAQPRALTLRAYTGEKFATFSLEDRKHGGNLNFKPNAVLTAGLGFNFRRFGFGISTSIPFRDDKSDLYGRTRRFDFQLHRYSRKLALDAYLQRYKGFHLNFFDQAPTYVPGNTEDQPAYPYFKDMRSIKAGATALYVFNGGRFSMRSAVKQQEWQTRSAGSPLAGIAFSFGDFSNDGRGLVPFRYPDTALYNGYNPTQIQTYGLTFHGGYGYTYVLREHWSATLSADVGLGPGVVHVEAIKTNNIARSTEREATALALNGRANVRASLAYNSEKFSVGLYAIATGDRYTLPPLFGGQVASTQGVLRLSFARRFDYNTN